MSRSVNNGRRQTVRRDIINAFTSAEAAVLATYDVAKAKAEGWAKPSVIAARVAQWRPHKRNERVRFNPLHSVGKIAHFTGKAQEVFNG